MKKWGLGFLVMVLSIGMCNAQNGLYYLDKPYESDDPLDMSTHLDLGINFLSNSVYLGRKDVNPLPYLTPYVGYSLRYGLYVSGSLSYAFTKKTGHVDMATVEAGYDHAFSRTVIGGIHAEKYFYYKNSPGVRSAITESGGIYCQVKNNWIEPSLSFDVNNSTSPDFVFAATLDHHFNLAQKKLHIYPAFTFYMGSLRFYDNYYINRTLKNDHIAISQAIETPGKIKPVNLELSARTTLYTGNWMFTLIPTYAIPLGESKVTLPGGITHEKLNNTFFIELDACYRKVRGE